MSEVNFKAELKTVTGEAIFRPVSNGDPVPMTLGWLAIEALMAVHRDDVNLDGNAKFARYLLAQKVNKTIEGEKVEFKTEDLAVLKEQIGKVFPAGFVGPAWEILG